MIRRALARDARRIMELANHYAARGEMLPLTSSDVYQHIRDFVVVEEGGEIVGCGALAVTWEDLAEIRSLAIDPQHRRRGYGRQMVECLLEEAQRLGIERVFALTYQIDFFEKMGFQFIEKERLPHKIWADCIVCPKFPNCDETAFIIHLEDGRAP